MNRLSSKEIKHFINMETPNISETFDEDVDPMGHDFSLWARALTIFSMRETIHPL
jgi:hypothetical protein